MSIYLTIFGKPRYLGLMNVKDETTFEDGRAGWVVVKTMRGYEMGLAGGKLSEEQQEKYTAASSDFENSADTMLQNVDFVKVADEYDIERYYRCREDEGKALIAARELLEQHKLDMKLVDAEYMLDRRKFYFYFTATQRVDFRLFVRDLAHMFRTRIEMRQVGIRDEAKIVRGLSTCGRPCCCSYWLRGFSPISIRIVKEQRSALNPTKISGLCGRLMCCMSYEKEIYSEMWSKLPGPGAKIKTEQGVYVLESLDLGREYVNIRFPSGRLVPVAISEFPDFQEAVLKGEEWGEDKELLEKKKAAAARMAALKERALRKKSSEVKVNAAPLRPRTDKPEKASKPPKQKAKTQKPKPKAKQNKPRKKPAKNDEATVA
ncbi:MAG: hypothetical protein IJP53_01590 [Synergistaceae bacterium]|nr:hypothetical protein [Synergistaceae bacterium]MBR0094322.1 hypothetical protein [Synergistaceae bacterium]